MTTAELLGIRLRNQQLSQKDFKSAGEVVEWMGAVQAQDYLGALWSLGMRLPATTEPDVEKAVGEKKIIRTWPMRGTLHFVSPKDIRWMLKYLAVRVQSKVASVFQREGLDSKQFTKAMNLWAKALVGGKSLTREEMYAVLERGKVSSKGIRGLLMLGVAAQEGLLCFGAREGKQQTLVLLDEWLPKNEPELSKEEALRRLAEIYVRSHGPVLVEDLAWWSGLTKTEANTAIKSLGNAVESVKCNNKTYWFFPDEPSRRSKPVCALLPTYDEFGIAYKDRAPIIHKTDLKQVGGFFTSGIMHNGKITGVWRRELEKGKVNIDIKPFSKYSAAQKKTLTSTIRFYSKFVGLQPEFKI